MDNPEDRKYTKGHEWAKKEGELIVVGITDFAQHALTDIVFVELPEKGKELEKGKQMCVVESVKSVSDIFAPVNGEVAEVNSELENSPEKLNQAPFDSWLVKIKPKDPAEFDSLMSSQQYNEYVAGLEH
ncbi:MAG: glycine cleavage system protein H [Candidatus Diapherotrites archaeon]|uniref:Probable glycine cleavage system H protein n=1 Tax=Candidatus Iainarchaeum sp. TaxID=3101447 RepID=A0A2D6M185_9ARCH|nr:glycine cleavage system protein H [Candidatus Diapherotrites archaeon]